LLVLCAVVNADTGVFVAVFASLVKQCKTVFAFLAVLARFGNADAGVFFAVIANFGNADAGVCVAVCARNGNADAGVCVTVCAKVGLADAFVFEAAAVIAFFGQCLADAFIHG